MDVVTRVEAETAITRSSAGDRVITCSVTNLEPVDPLELEPWSSVEWN